MKPKSTSLLYIAQLWHVCKQLRRFVKSQRQVVRLETDWNYVNTFYKKYVCLENEKQR